TTARSRSGSRSMPGICNSFALAAAFVGLSAVAAAQSTKPLATIGKIAVVEEYASGLEHPWGLAFLPDGRALVTEREGRLRLVENGRLSAPLFGVPDVFARGQGGLLD